MRRTPIGLAVAVRDGLGVVGIASEDEVRAGVAADGLLVVDGWGFRSHRQRAMRVDGAIYLKAGLSAGWRRALLAHEFGHAKMHTGNHLYLAVPQTVHLRNRQEREAQAFAGALLLGDPFRAGFDDVLQEAYEEQGLPVEFLFGFLHAAIYRGD